MSTILREITNQDIQSQKAPAAKKPVKWVGTRTRFDEEGNPVEVIKGSSEASKEENVHEAIEEQVEEEATIENENENGEEGEECETDLWSYREPSKEETRWCGTHIKFEVSDSEEDETTNTNTEDAKVNVLQEDLQKLSTSEKQ
jgi:hypothetical protein